LPDFARHGDQLEMGGFIGHSMHPARKIGSVLSPFPHLMKFDFLYFQ